jgi:hypothetical protein
VLDELRTLLRNCKHIMGLSKSPVFNQFFFLGGGGGGKIFIMAKKKIANATLMQRDSFGKK